MRRVDLVIGETTAEARAECLEQGIDLSAASSCTDCFAKLSETSTDTIVLVTTAAAHAFVYGVNKSATAALCDFSQRGGKVIIL